MCGSDSKKMSFLVHFSNGETCKVELDAVKKPDDYGNGWHAAIVWEGYNTDYLDMRYDERLRHDGSNMASWFEQYMGDRFGKRLESLEACDEQVRV